MVFHSHLERSFSLPLEANERQTVPSQRSLGESREVPPTGPRIREQLCHLAGQSEAAIHLFRSPGMVTSWTVRTFKWGLQLRAHLSRCRLGMRRRPLAATR